MRIVMFYHSLISDWNYGNAHFLRGLVSELKKDGHDVLVYEPRLGWSFRNLVEQHGKLPLFEFKEVYPRLFSIRYDLEELDLEEVLDGADLVLVHEWNEPELIKKIGLHRKGHGEYRLMFHDTNHRIASAPESIREYDLQHYDGILAFGRILQERYRELGFTNVYVWHEAADVDIFRPLPNNEKVGDLVWIGNGRDGESNMELKEFLLDPVKKDHLRARLYGVRFTQNQLEDVADSGMEYWGWLANYKVPEALSLFHLTLHIPRRFYVNRLPGIPTIRVFEALACGVPLICSPWSDTEKLFMEGRDYLMARNGREMESLIKELLADPEHRSKLARHGRQTILERHTCRHRVEELLRICCELKPSLNRSHSVLVNSEPYLGVVS